MKKSIKNLLFALIFSFILLGSTIITYSNIVSSAPSISCTTESCKITTQTNNNIRIATLFVGFCLLTMLFYLISDVYFGKNKK